MIGTVFKISVLRLWNNKQELVLALAVPIMFFSIFAFIFSRGVEESIAQVRVSFVDDDKTLESRAIIQAASQHKELRAVTGVWRTSDTWPIEKLSRLLISQKAVEVVVHIPAGFTAQDPEHPHLSIRLLNEGTNPIAHRVVQAGLAESIALQFAKPIWPWGSLNRRKFDRRLPHCRLQLRFQNATNANRRNPRMRHRSLKYSSPSMRLPTTNINRKLRCMQPASP